MSTRGCLTLYFCFGLLLSSATFSWAQRSAGLTGTASDNSGAVVSNVNVTVMQQLTGVKRSTVTNNSGVYQFVELEPGPYAIEASIGGFKTFESRADLSAAHIATVNIKLDVGATSEIVQVSAQAAALETASATVGSEITQQMISNLPVLSRNAYALLPITMGYSTPWKTSGDPAFAGGIPGSTAYFVDGADALDTRVQTGNFTSPASLEIMSEVKVAENNFGAEYGQNGGAVVLMQTKSGTNEFHGSLFEFYQSEALNARNYFATGKTPNLSNDFGVEIGGPIIKNKLHFFYSYEGIRIHASNTVAGGGGGGATFETVPTALQRIGDFSQTFNSAGVLTPIYDPRSTVVHPDGSITRTQLSCNGVLNVICPNQISPIAAALMAYEPLPNHAAADPSGTNNSYGVTNNLNHSNQQTAKVDWDPTGKDKIFVRFLWDTTLTEQYGPWPALANFNQSKIKFATHAMNPADPTENVNKVSYGNAAVGWTRTINKSLVSDFHFGTHPDNNIYQAPSAGLGFAGLIGLPVPTLPDPTIKSLGIPNNAFPSFSAGPYTLPGANAGAGMAVPYLNSWDFIETISWLRGKHSFKAGFDYKYSEATRYIKTGSSGRYNFSSSTTASNPFDPNSGNALASLLLDFPVSGSLTDSDEQSFKTNYYAWFVQDEWKVRPNLTVNIGLRHEIDTPLTEMQNRINGFDATAINPVSNTPGVITFPTSAFPSSQFSNVPTNGFTRPEYSEFGPRLGVSYNPGGGKMVFRGGFGIFYNEFQQLDIWSIPSADRPDVNTTVSASTPDNGVTAPYFLSTGLPQPTPFSPSVLNPGFGAVAPDANGQFRPKKAVTFIPRNNKSGYQEDFAFSVQRAAWNSVLELGYQGNMGHRLAVCNGGYGCYLELNTLSPAQRLALGPTATQKNRPFPQFSAVGELNPSNYNSAYNALYFKASRNYSNGLSFLTHFTWAKTIDDYSAGTGLDLYVRKRGLSYTDRTLHYVFAGSYDLPAGRGRRFLNHGPLSYALGGWRVAPILNVETGQPLAPNLGNVPGAQYANCIGNPNSGPKTLKSWFNLSAFGTPAPYTNGNCPQNVIIGPGWVQLDMSIQKDFPIYKESKKMEFRMDSSNILNHPNFGNPSATICPASAPCSTNLITSAYTGRNIQLALRFSF